MSVIASGSFLAVGRVLGAHGIRGEVRVEVMTDFPERFAPGAELWLEGNESPYRVSAARPHKGSMLVKLDNVRDRTQAELLQGLHLLVPRERALPLPEGEYYTDELVGLRVLTEEALDLGLLVDVLVTGANDVYMVEGAYGEVLLPAIAEVIQEVDLQNRKIVVRLLPGLIPELESDLDDSRS